MIDAFQLNFGQDQTLGLAGEDVDLPGQARVRHTVPDLFDQRTEAKGFEHLLGIVDRYLIFELWPRNAGPLALYRHIGAVIRAPDANAGAVAPGNVSLAEPPSGACPVPLGIAHDKELALYLDRHGASLCHRIPLWLAADTRINFGLLGNYLTSQTLERDICSHSYIAENQR